MNRIPAVALLLVATGCQQSAAPQNRTVLLGGAYNMNGKCVGHATGLCGTEQAMLPTEIAGIFATEPDCERLRFRGLTEQERSTPGNQLPLLLDVYYEGTRTEPYMGTGKDEDEGWMFTFQWPTRALFSQSSHRAWTKRNSSFFILWKDISASGLKTAS